MATAALDLFVGLEPDSEESDETREIPVSVPVDAFGYSLEYIARDQIHPDPFQPRTDADDELRASIATSGILEPLILRLISPVEGTCSDCGRSWEDLAAAGEYMIHNGERRWRGAKGVQAILPAIVRSDLDADPVERLITQLAANAHKAMAPIDEARAYRQIIERTHESHAWLAARIGKKRQTISDRLALLKNEAWVPLLESGEITVSQMVELSRYADEPVERQHDAMAAMRDIAGGACLAAMDVKVFREQLRAVAFFDPNARTAPAAVVTEQTDIADVEQAAGDDASSRAGDDTPDPDSFQATVKRRAEDVLLPISRSYMTDADKQRPVEDLDTAVIVALLDSLRLEFHREEDTEARNEIVLDRRLLKWELDRRDASDPTTITDTTVEIAGRVDAEETPLTAEADHVEEYEPGDVDGDVSEAEPQSNEVHDSEPANHEHAASASRGTAPADLGNPPSQDSDPSLIGGQVRGDAVTELPDTERAPAQRTTSTSTKAPAAGPLQAILPLFGSGGGSLLVGRGKRAETFRLTVMPQAKKGDKAALTVPMSFDGTPAELDAEIPAAIAAFLQKRGTVADSVTASAQKVAETAKTNAAAKKTAPAERASKPAAKKALAKKTPTKPAAAKKVAAKKAVAKRVAKPKKAAKPELVPDSALAAVLGSSPEWAKVPVKLPAMVKVVHQYAKNHKLVGDGAMRGMIGCDEKLRAIFGSPVVKLNQLAKLLKSHLVVRRPDPATNDSGDSGTPPP